MKNSFVVFLSFFVSAASAAELEPGQSIIVGGETISCAQYFYYSCNCVYAPRDRREIKETFVLRSRAAGQARDHSGDQTRECRDRWYRGTFAAADVFAECTQVN